MTSARRLRGNLAALAPIVCSIALSLSAFAQQATPSRVWPSSASPQSAPAAQTPTPAATTAAPAAPDATPVSTSANLTVDAAQDWIDTGITLSVGDRCQFSADGTITLATRETAGPDGRTRGWRDVIQALPVGNVGRGALVARIQGDVSSAAFLLGSKGEFTAASSGKLMLGINQLSSQLGTGTYKVMLTVTRAANPSAAAAAVAPSVATLELPNSSDLLSKVPRRIADKDGNPGDMVNFVVLGDGDKLLSAFKNAGWVVVDRSKQEAFLHGLVATLSKQSYTELPMSELYLFGRAQDYGLAHADPLTVVSTRHHLRLWKAPFQFNDQDVWVGAATHDIGFDRDQRNNGVTHKIDPNVDDEREFVRTSLVSTGMIGGENSLTPTDALKEARTATGATFHSDGRVFLFRLRDAASESSNH